MPRFKVDENLPREVGQLLADAGHDAMTVGQQQMIGEADMNLARVCQREHRVFMTLDRHFSDIRAYPPSEYDGIIVFRLAHLDKPRILAVVRQVLSLFERLPLAGQLWIVDESSVRVRT